MAFLTGTTTDDRIQGTRREDIVFGSDGDDSILTYGEPQGGGPFAVYRAQATDGADIVLAGEGDDRVSTGGGADTIYGGEGDDVITAGAGADAIFGGSGDDVFTFGWLGGPSDQADTRTGRNGRDSILDFQQGSDLIDLSGYAEASGAVWIGTDRPTNTDELQVGYRTEGFATIVEFYAPSDGRGGRAPRLTGEIEVLGPVTLTEGDFVF